VENKSHSGQERLRSDANPFASLLERTHALKPLHPASPPAAESNKEKPVEGIVVGQLVGLTEEGGFLVQFPGNPSAAPVQALAATEINPSRIGKPVALSFVAGNIQQPLILGFIQTSAHETKNPGEPIVEVEQDGKRLVISAADELVLKCGDSTITLTKAGKITIRGKHLLSRAEAVNRIKGGAVQIN
jgi:hypothetical protein